jgi:hypothetical protein
MMMTPNPSDRAVTTALASPAVSLLCELENAATASGGPLRVTFTVQDRMVFEPRSILTPERIAQIRQHRDALAVLVRLAQNQPDSPYENSQRSAE